MQNFTTTTVSLLGKEKRETPIPLLQFLKPIDKEFCRNHLILGRSPSCDLVIEDPRVSTRHAEIFVHQGSYIVRDLHSRNGTFLNDEKVTEQSLPLKGMLRLGNYDLPYRIVATASVQSDQENRVVGVEIPGTRPGSPPRIIVGQSSSFKRMMKELKKIAPRDDTILLLGETGVGKDLLAQYLHSQHPTRKTKPIVIVNCATIPETMADSQLFGHAKGSFTGAMSDHQGFFQQAHGGTLFLDEIGELSLTSQARLLRVIEEKIIRPIGSTREASVDVRLVFATNRNLEEAQSSKTFRQDLYERFEWMIKIPPLRERVEDIPLIARYLIQQQATTPLVLPIDLENFLQSYPWRGNVRALNRTLRRAITNATHRGASTLSQQDFEPMEETPMSPSLSATEKRSLQRGALEDTLKANGGNITKTAKQLGVSRLTIHKWMKGK